MKRIWKSDKQYCAWTKSRTLDLGKKVLVEVEKPERIVLTEKDLHFYPTQEQLKTIEFVAPKNVYDKLFKAYYNVREVSKKGKVLDSKNVLKCL